MKRLTADRAVAVGLMFLVAAGCAIGVVSGLRNDEHVYAAVYAVVAVASLVAGFLSLRYGK